MQTASTRTSSGTADLLRHGGHSTLLLAVRFIGTIPMLGRHVGSAMLVPSFNPVSAAVGTSAASPRRAALTARSLPMRALWSAAHCWALVSWGMRLSSVAASRGLRSRVASAHPCSSTPSSMLPAMAAVVGGGRGGMWRRPSLVWPAPRASARMHSLWSSPLVGVLARPPPTPLILGDCLPLPCTRAIAASAISLCSSSLFHRLLSLVDVPLSAAAGQYVCAESRLACLGVAGTQSSSQSHAAVQLRSAT